MANGKVAWTISVLLSMTAVIMAHPKLVTRDSPGSSIQILYAEKDGNHAWWVWAGPFNIAVNPCEAPPFEFISATQAVQYIPKGDDPIFPGLGEVTWSGNFPHNQEQNCLIKGRGNKNAPTLKCGDNLSVDFKHDARFNDDAISCPNGFNYKRGWTAEY